MADVFLSYSREDQATARHFANGLQREGFSVWWDQTLRSGDAFDRVTEKALEEAGAVVVLWSKASVESRWVRAEATQADRSGTLRPVMIEDCKRPIMFELTHTTDLSGWQGDAHDSRWKTFMDDLRATTGLHPAITQSPQAALPQVRTAKRRGSFLAVAAIAALALIAATWVLLRNRDSGRTEATATHAANQNPAAGTRIAAEVTLAGLPFADISPNKDQEYFADGITEEILNSLARLKGLQVSGRTSSFFFKGKNEDMRIIGERLGVENLLEGSIRKDGENLRITAQLVKAKDGFHLWSETYDRSTKDVFAVQEDIARSVARALQVTLGVGELGALPGMTRDAEAYEAYVEGQGCHRQGTASGNWSLGAQEKLELAVKLDPSFLLAWLELSSVYRDIALGDPGPGGLAKRAQADAALDTARRLSADARLVQSLDITRLLPRGEWSRVEKGIPIIEAVTAEFRHAAALSSVGTFELLSLAVDKAARAIPGLERDKRLDPLNMRVAFNLAGAYAHSGRIIDAMSELDRNMAISSVDVNAADNAVFLARTMGDEKRVEAGWQRLAAIDHSELTLKMQALRRRPADARKALRTFIANPELAPSTQIAFWAVYFDDPELALQALQANNNPELRLVTALTSWWPQMASMRRLPGFKDLVRKLGLVDYWREFGWGPHCKPVGTTDFECH